MARLAQDVVPVVDEKATVARAHRPGGGRRRASQAGGPLGGPYGASFTGIGTPGLRLERRWTRPGVHPYDEVTWELRTASITNESGKVVFEQRDVEVPSFWSQLATNVVVSKYFRGHIGTPERERSVKQLIDRVVNTICGWAEAQHYFATPDDLETFRAELTHLLLHQKMSFNSPVWFNVGIEPKPQCSACFINSVEDNMGSIMDLAKTEAMLFKYGSGAGVNLSPIRSSKERMSGGGMASGPVSFMKGYDAFAGVIKCLTADTYITTGSGLLRIDEAIETDGPVGFTEDDSLTLNTPAGPKRISHVYRSPLADVRTVTLRTGLTLTGTHEHPVLTLASPFELRWTRLADLQPGDRVAVERRRELWPSQAPALDGFTPDLVVERRELRYPSEMTPELARLLGYLVAEGSVECERFRFSSADPEVMADYCRCVEAVFGVDPRSQVRHEINPSTGVRTESVSLSWKGALQFLAYCGLPAGPSAAKSVPVTIRRSPRSLVLEFLGAYSEGDAHIGEQRIEISSASKRLLEEIQLLALNMGVVGRRHSRNGYEHLTFFGADAARLARLLRPYLVTPRKRDAAATLAADRAGERNPNADVIPGLVPALRAFAIAGNGWFRSDAGDVVRSGFGIFNRSSDNVSYARARAIPDLTAKIARLSPGLANTVETVLEDEYLWDEVVSVADTGQALTYDFTVPEVHAFVSNGIVSHNSGGKTRRAAKMVILNVDHPDILEFIDSKANEEKKAWALIAAGYDPSFTGEAYGSVFFQNANHSVRVTDEFMKAVVEDREWTVRAVTTGEPLATYRAREIWRRMAEAAWLCGDPGVQYDTTINDWHTCANTDRIYASNPCVTGDTLVATDRGWRTIESLVGETVDVIGLDGRAHRVTRVFPTGRKPVFELKTRLGYRVKITADHKVRTERGDVAVKDLRPDDVILLDRPGFGRTTLSPNLAEAIGLAVGDGCLTWSEPNGRLQPMIVITMAAEEAPLLARIADEINAQKRLLRAVGAPGRGDAVHVTLGAGVSRLAFASRPVVERFMEYAVLDEGAELKRFKPAVYDLDRPSLAALLRGLFTADGTVGRNPRKGAYVGLDSTSLELLVQVQRLLLAFGIKSRIYENRRRGSLRTLLPNGRGGTATYRVKQVHALRISRTSRVTFEREIGFASESPKAAALRSANASATPRRELLSDRVGSVRPLGIEPVFDLTEPATHHFVANGLVVHNCSEFMFLNDTACFAPETRISTPDGLRTVEELYQAQQRGERVLITTDLVGEHDHRRLTAHRPAIVTRVGERPVFRMTLNDGRSIRTTGDHRFLTADGGWKRVDELIPGQDRIEIRRSGNPVRFESPAAEVRRWQMLGWMTGDGVFSRGTAGLIFGPQETGTAELLTEEFNRLLKEAHERAGIVDELDHALRRGALLTADGVFPAGIGRRSTSLSVQRNGVQQISSKARALVRFLEDRYGMRQGTATTKDVPAEIHRVPDDLKVAYLQGLFSADGTIRYSASASEPEVMLATSSPALARSVQLLLSDLGIASRISWHHPAGRTNPQGQLHISNQAARAFLSLVGFPLSAAKQAQVSAILARPFDGARKNPRPATVVAVEPDGIETVYDITEPVTHSVVAEGLIAHNCNLASLNLMKFVGEDGEFDVEAFRHAARVTITAQEIIVDNASYPTPKIEERSHRFRPLGLGYANLGALLMSRGLPYDSDEGRNYAAAITAIMTGEAYRQSAIIARDHGGPFVEFEANREPFLRVIGKHREAAYRIPGTGVPAPMLEAARRLWDETVELGERHGYRNAQVTVLAPTGTIAFMMDCDTTGIEPDIALVKYKKLVGEGYLKIVNTTVPIALRRLGYSPAEVEEIVRYIDERETIEGAPHLRPEHLPVFDCAFKPVNGQRSIHYMGHVRMMAAVQPFLSGAISKTVNMPESATVEDIEQVYLEGWRLGLKAIAIYRDGSKKSQPLTAGKKTPEEAAAMAKEIEELRRQLAEAQAEALKPHRRRLPAERQAVTHKFEIAGHEGYITVGLYPDGQPGEIFLKMAKEGSTVSGLMDSFATAISLALQYGVPLRDLVNKFAHVRFEPSGFTGNPEIPIAKSIVDYIFRWLGSRFLPPDDRAMLGLVDRSAVVAAAPPSSGLAAATAPAPEEGLSAIDEATHRLEPAGEQPPAGGEPPRATATATAEAARAAATEGHAPAGNGRTGNGHLASGPGLALSLGGTKVSFQAQADAPSCPECGSIMVRNGSCYKCLNCGATSGCS